MEEQSQPISTVAADEADSQTEDNALNTVSEGAQPAIEISASDVVVSKEAESERSGKSEDNSDKGTPCMTFYVII